MPVVRCHPYITVLLPREASRAGEPPSRLARPVAGAAKDHGMGMRKYELMMITHGSLDEPAVQANVGRFTKLITDQGGVVERIDHWGKREFAYEIDHMREGYYTVVDLQITPAGLSEVERQLRLADEVVRHKVVRPAPRTKRMS